VARVVGSVLVHNEDVFVEQAIRDAAVFCDRIHAVDHMSSDGTWEILRALAREFDHLDISRVHHSRVSHEVLELYAGTETWVLRIDGDELYDPQGLAVLRESLVGGAHREVFRVLGNVLHAVELDRDDGTASGYLSPPSRPISALYNLGAVESWTGSPQRLHAGRPVFRRGYHWGLVDHLYERFDWSESPLRCLHACFLRRSSVDTDNSPRGNLGELGMYRRSPIGAAERFLRRIARRPAGDPRLVGLRAGGSSWKLEKYRRGELVTVDASPFFSVGARTESG
jgi:glycosyltransferase involved in cell wall biosynthesis